MWRQLGYVWSFKQQSLISHHQTRHFTGGVILCETKEQTQDIYGLILLSIKSSGVLLLTYAYQFRMYDPDNKINTAAEKQKKDTKPLSYNALCLHKERYRIQVSKVK